MTMIEKPATSLPTPAPAALTRRNLFILAGASAALSATPLAARSFGSGFTHGVASGEPAANSVLLWTRYVADADTRLTWEVSASEDFSRPLASGEAIASPARDCCAKATAQGLAPGQWYYYRFIAPGGAVSDTGRTRTLPQGPTAAFRLAVFSCSNYGFGHFNAYGHAAEVADCDLALHLGDYLYEYAKGNYPSSQQAAAERTLAPENEIVTLADYRLRYATYRADPDLRRIHRIMPMICIMDDHETANDSWHGGAQNHDPATEGAWDVRKAIAVQVNREWLPVSDEPYAAYQIGDLATLFRLETRLLARDQQLDLGAVLKGLKDPASIVTALEALRDGAWADPARTLLGAAQEKWLAQGLAASAKAGTAWQVLVQQVLMGNLKTPAGLAERLGTALPDFIRQRVMAATMASKAGLPSNMDAWDGYPAARARVLQSALDADANLLVLAGDTHNGWAFELAHEGTAAGVEFGVQSVSSPGFESYLAFLPPADLAAALVETNQGLKWADTAQRGYMVVELTPARATTEYRFTGSARQRSTRLAGTRRIAAEAGAGKLAV
ncbi:MAG: alkaline phosphatase D family protein [Porphyrobacter sp.]|nr:alkaline phosphatase D family protein [Porphyrobacter sp.]